MARRDGASSSVDSQPLLVGAWPMGDGGGNVGPDGGGNVGPDGGLGNGCTEEWRVTSELNFGPKKIRRCFSIRNFSCPTICDFEQNSTFFAESNANGH